MHHHVRGGGSPAPNHRGSIILIVGLRVGRSRGVSRSKGSGGGDVSVPPDVLIAREIRSVTPLMGSL